MTDSSLVYKPILTSSLKDLPTYTTNVSGPSSVVNVDGLGGKSYLQSTSGAYVRNDEEILLSEFIGVNIIKLISDTIIVQDVFNNINSKIVTIIDIADASDIKLIETSKATSETLVVSEIVSKLLDSTNTENLLVSEVFSLLYDKDITEVITVSDLFDSLAQTQSFLGREDDDLILREDGFFIIRESNDLDTTEDLALASDTLIASANKSILDIVTTTDHAPIFSSANSQTLDTPVLSDTILISLLPNYVDVLTALEIIEKTVSNNIVDSSTTLDNTSASATKISTDSINLSESVLATITKVIADSADVSDNDGFNNSFILREDGFFILREDNSNIYREDAF